MVQGLNANKLNKLETFELSSIFELLAYFDLEDTKKSKLKTVSLDSAPKEPVLSLDTKKYGAENKKQQNQLF